MQAKTPKAARLVLAASVLVLCLFALSGCDALTGYRDRVGETTMEWEREKAALILELEQNTISKDQYQKERAELEKAYRDELAKATAEFKVDAKEEAQAVAQTATNPWGLGATVLGSILAGWYATRTSKKYTDENDEWYDRERDRRRAARGEAHEIIETVEKKPA